MGELEICDEKSISYVFKLLFENCKHEFGCEAAAKVNILFKQINSLFIYLFSRLFRRK